MRTTKPVFMTSLAIFFLIPLAKGQSAPEPNPEEVIKAFFGANPPNDKLIAVLEKGAKEPYKTELVKKIMAQKPSIEEASRVLVQNPPEPYAQQAWKIVEIDGSPKDRCRVLNSASEEYQNKALTSIRERKFATYEHVFYLMQGAPKRLIPQIWDDFMKLKPTKEDILSAATNAKSDFQEMAILHSLTQNLTASELDSVFKLISEIEVRKAKKREEKLIEIMTRKQ